jgi:hypothetical protein
MSDNPDKEDDATSPADQADAEKHRLEKEIEEVRQHARHQIMLADLTVAAVRAGMIDLDGIRLLDLTSVPKKDDGRVADPAGLMADLKRAKPWLFGSGSTSSVTDVPPSTPPRQKLATEMSDEEYRAARTLILKRRY